MLIVVTQFGFHITTVDSRDTANRYLEKTYTTTKYAAFLYGPRGLVWANVELDL